MTHGLLEFLMVYGRQPVLVRNVWSRRIVGLDDVSLSEHREDVECAELRVMAFPTSGGEP